MSDGALRTRIDATTQRATLAMVAVGAAGVGIALPMLGLALDPASLGAGAWLTISSLSFFAWLAGPIFFGRWLYAACQDCALLGGRPLRLSPGAAIGSFFIPIVSLFRPCQAITDLHDASDPAPLPDPPRYETSTVLGDYRSSALSVMPKPNWVKPFPVRAWWGLFLVHQITVSVRGAAMLEPAWQVALGVHAVADVASAVLAILVIRSIVARQRERLRRIEVAAAG
jgi:hypothetical protein